MIPQTMSVAMLGVVAFDLVALLLIQGISLLLSLLIGVVIALGIVRAAITTSVQILAEI